MAEGKCRDEWRRTSSLMAHFGNQFLAKGAKPYTPSDFDPFSEKNKAGPKIKIDQKNGFAALKLMFSKE
jgi:hypothetical protein